MEAVKDIAMNTNVAENKPKTIAALALQIAISQIGQKEAPGNKNTGVMVDKYLAAVGLNPGYPWCQAFVNWCYEQAALQLGVPEPVPNTGGVLECWRRVAPQQKIVRAVLLANHDLIQPGDQGIMKLGTKGAGHTFLIVRTERRSGAGLILHTIEGNTNEAGEREGYKVAYKERRLDMKELVGIIRYS